MEKITTIVDGFTQLAKKTVGMPNEEVELTATLRERVCNGCIVDNNPVLFEGKCTKCGCVMAAKWRAINAKCPIGKW